MAGAAATIACGVVVGGLFVFAGVAAWVTGSAAGEALGDLSVRDQRDGGVIPPISDPYPLRRGLDLRPSTPLIVPLGPSELGWGTPGGGGQLPSPCRALHLGWRACVALVAGATGLGGLPFFLHENSEGIHDERRSEGK